MNFGNRLRQLRKAKGLTQAELAKLLSIGESTISFYESGKRQPDYETLIRIADLFNVSVDYLLGRTDDTTDIYKLKNIYPYPLGKIVKIPIIGIIRAGSPLLAEENLIGWREVSEEIIKDGGEYFYLLVAGDSMENAHIPDGSLVLVRRQDYVDNNATFFRKNKKPPPEGGGKFHINTRDPRETGGKHRAPGVIPRR